jgi:16S rRNA (adenine1518-N6/adenine1519-N6)-dimethyltransferase
MGAAVKRKRKGAKRSKPRLSQHLLRDASAARRIVSYAAVSSSDRVLEIGPGRGALTKPLLATGAKVYAIEADRAMADALLRETRADNLIMMITDATRASWPEVEKIVSNLPYHVTTPLVLRVLDSPVKLSVLTVQKEYADRMAAEARDDAYSRLSVAVACRAECEVLETLPPGAFDPPPKVSSSVVRLRPRAFPFKVKSEPLFWEVVKALFEQRRKKVGTVMRATAGLRGVPHGDSRPEELTPQQLGEVADAVYEEVEDEARQFAAKGQAGGKRSGARDEDDDQGDCDETCADCL